jgi:hypothetical protein
VKPQEYQAHLDLSTQHTLDASQHVPITLDSRIAPVSQHQPRQPTQICPLARTRITTKLTRQQAQSRSSDMDSHMASPSYIIIQVSSNLPSCVMHVFVSSTPMYSCLKVYIQNIAKNKKLINMRQAQRSETVRETIGSSTNLHKNTKTNQILCLSCIAPLYTQDIDQAMIDSCSSPSNKRGQLTVHQLAHKKKTRNDLQSEHVQYASQDLWLGFHVMELIAKDNAALPCMVTTPIRELIRSCYRKNEAAEIHTAKFSYL